MLTGYNIKVAWRSLKGHKFYNLLNILGLTLGMATSILVLIWVHFQYSFDRFHQQADQIYRINTTLVAEDGPITWDKAPSGLPVLTKGVTGIQGYVRMRSWGDQLVSTVDKTKITDGNHIAYTDPELLSVFDFSLLYGNKHTCLNDINAAVITHQLALQLFGQDKVVGRQIKYFGDIYNITAVLKDFPKNSTLQYQAFFPMSAFARRVVAEGNEKNIDFIDQQTGRIAFDDYLVLTPTANPASIATAISQNYARQQDSQQSTSMTFSLKSLKDLHLIQADGNPSELRMVQMLLLVAILVLVVACINYMNLTTARSLTRLKEVAVRKINGATKTGLFRLFMTEAVLLFLISTALALMLVYFLLPLVSQFTGAALKVVSTDAETMVIVAAVVVGTLLVATVFPAYLLSGLRVTTGLKTGAKEGRFTSGRKVLVTLQFSAAFILLMGAIVIHRQMQFIASKDIGYDRNYVFVAPMTSNMVDKEASLEAELLKSTAIQSVGVSNAYDLSNVQNVTSNIEWPGKPENDNTMFSGLSGDKDFVAAMQFHFVAGNNFTGQPSDSDKIIINEVAAQRMHLKPPYVGQALRYNNSTAEVLGVVKNFNYLPLTKAIGPLIIDNKGFKNILYVKTTAAHAGQALKETERLYKLYSGGAPFGYSFLDKNFEAKYLSEKKASGLLKGFSTVALVISCLGLFGLATFMAEVRRKEIGIRKVLGASIRQLMGLITSQFLKLVLLAVVIGAPVAFYITTRWQNHFVYKVHVGLLTFIIGATIIIAIAVITILFIALKSARANPVNSIKAE